MINKYYVLFQFTRSLKILKSRSFRLSNRWEQKSIIWLKWNYEIFIHVLQSFVTVDNEKKKIFLAKRNDLNSVLIFKSQNSTFFATSSKKVDVDFDFLADDMLHANFETCVEFDRFVEVDKWHYWSRQSRYDHL